MVEDSRATAVLFTYLLTPGAGVTASPKIAAM